MVDVWDRMTELQFANKTGKDVALAQRINKLVAVIEQLQGVAAGDRSSILRHPDFADLAKYKVFDNIIPIANNESEPVSSSADFSRASIERRIQAGYRDASIALASPPQAASQFRQAIQGKGQIRGDEIREQEMRDDKIAAGRPKPARRAQRSALNNKKPS